MQPIQSDVQVESFYMYSQYETEEEALAAAKSLAETCPGTPFYVMRPAFVAFVGSIVLAAE